MLLTTLVTIKYVPQLFISDQAYLISVTDTSSCCFQVRDLDFAIQIVGSEIVREADGLAMSSRNVNLSHQDREKVCPLLEVVFWFGNEPFF